MWESLAYIIYYDLQSFSKKIGIVGVRNLRGPFPNLPVPSVATLSFIYFPSQRTTLICENNRNQKKNQKAIVIPTCQNIGIRIDFLFLNRGIRIKPRILPRNRNWTQDLLFGICLYLPLTHLLIILIKFSRLFHHR